MLTEKQKKELKDLEGKVCDEEVNTAPLCSDGKFLKSNIGDSRGAYCSRNFYAGEHCPYLRINDRQQKCVYYEVKK